MMTQDEGLAAAGPDESRRFSILPKVVGHTLLHAVYNQENKLLENVNQNLKRIILLTLN